MKRWIWISGLAVLVASSFAAGAVIIEQTQDFSGTPNFDANLVFDEFDDDGGNLTLQSIRVDVSLNVTGGSLKVDNDGNQPASGAVEFGAEVLLSSTVSLVDASLQPIVQPGDVKATDGTTLSVTADDGDTEVGGTPNFSYLGTDYDFFNGTAQSDSDFGYVSSSAFSQYIGTGTYIITVDADQVADYGALGGVQAQIDPLSASGQVKITYSYVPEPAALGLLAIGGVAILFRRRRR
jgi:hypothetical protein